MATSAANATSAGKSGTARSACATRAITAASSDGDAINNIATGRDTDLTRAAARTDATGTARTARAIRTAACAASPARAAINVVAGAAYGTNAAAKTARPAEASSCASSGTTRGTITARAIAATRRYGDLNDVAASSDADRSRIAARAGATGATGTA